MFVERQRHVHCWFIVLSMVFGVIGSAVMCRPSECSALPIAAGIGGSVVSPSLCTSVFLCSIRLCVMCLGRLVVVGML